MGKLSGKVIIVTGSTKGIGFAIAKRLANEGANIVISSRSEDNVKAAVSELKNLRITNVVGTVCHVANSKDRSKLFLKAIETFGHIDALISNAAVNPASDFTTLNIRESMWDKIFEVNVKSAFLLTQEVVPYLIKNNGGHIIYISSVSGLTPFAYSMGTYSVSKTALLGLTKVFATELASHNINVNCIAPGVINTEFSKKTQEDKFWQDHITKNILLGRNGEADEIAGCAVFLCSDDAKYITGETIVVAGGLPSRL